MPTLRWEGDGRFTDQQRNFVARPDTEYDLSEEQAEQYRSHALFGEDWVDVDGESETDTDAEGDSDQSDESNTESEETGEDDFTTLDGIGDATAEHLRDAGYTTFDDLRAADVEDLDAVEGITENKAMSILSQVSEE